MLNELVFIDAFEVKLTDGSNVLLLMILDDASRLGIATPVDGARNISTEEAIHALTKSWVNAYGPPKEIQYDAATAFHNERFESYLMEIGAKAHPILAEAHWHQGACERRIGIWEQSFIRMAAEAQITVEDDAVVWCAKLNHALNSRLREGGFSP